MVSFLHMWYLHFQTKNLSTWEGLYDPPFKSSYTLENSEKNDKNIKYFQIPTAFWLRVVRTPNGTQINRLWEKSYFCVFEREIDPNCKWG